MCPMLKALHSVIPKKVSLVHLDEGNTDQIIRDLNIISASVEYCKLFCNCQTVFDIWIALAKGR